MKIILSLLIILITIPLYSGVLSNLENHKLDKYKGKLENLLKSEENYSLAVQYLDNNKKTLKYLKKELDKVVYNSYNPEGESEKVMYVNVMRYMKLLTIDVINNLKTGKKNKFIKSLKYQIKFFKIVLKKNVLLNNMIVVANEKKLFVNLNKFINNNENDTTKKSKSILKKYYLFRKKQFPKTVMGEWKLMSNELLTKEDLTKEFTLLDKEAEKRVFSYILKKEKSKIDKIIYGVKNNKNESYFKAIDDDEQKENIKMKLLKAYFILGISFLYRDVNKPYRLPNIYPETIGEIILNIGSLPAHTYYLYYKKELEILELIKN